jgi:hypothetical protein
MLGRVDAINADITAIEDRIGEHLVPFAAAVIIAEIGVDMSHFPTAAHLVSWARFAPGVKESAGKHKGRGSTGHGNPYLARVLGEVAVVAGRTDTFLGERYRRIAKRRGKKRAIVAVGRSILISIWHLLADPDTTSTTWARTSTTPASAQTARNATTSANSKPSATQSPSNPPPETSCPPLRCAAPRAVACHQGPIFGLRLPLSTSG